MLPIERCPHWEWGHRQHYPLPCFRKGEGKRRGVVGDEAADGFAFTFDGDFVDEGFDDEALFFEGDFGEPFEHVL